MSATEDEDDFFDGFTKISREIKAAVKARIKEGLSLDFDVQSQARGEVTPTLRILIKNSDTWAEVYIDFKKDEIIIRATVPKTYNDLIYKETPSGAIEEGPLLHCALDAIESNLKRMRETINEYATQDKARQNHGDVKTQLFWGRSSVVRAAIEKHKTKRGGSGGNAAKRQRRARAAFVDFGAA